METVYFDHAATGIPRKEALQAAENAFYAYGNPSSLHKAGREAKKLIDDARKLLSSALRCNSGEVFFTSGGTESNITAIFGGAKMRARHSKTVITTDSEHPSVALPIAALEKEGYIVKRLSTKGGRIDMQELENALAGSVSLVSIMLVNNETGAIYDIPAIRHAIDKSKCGALLHVDAVQGFLKLRDKTVIKKNCDLASVSAHKIGGIKGAGALFVKNGIKLPPLMLGGGQEGGMRSGTENVPAIAAFGAAAEAFSDAELTHIEQLNEYTTKLIRERLPQAVIRLPEKRSASILSISVIGARSEVMLNALSAEGICVSAGSACSSKRGVSHVLEAYGASNEELATALRISFGAENTEKECELLIERIADIAKKLVK